MFTALKEALQANPKTIVFTEGTDRRILEAADRLSNSRTLNVILLSPEKEVLAAADKYGFDVKYCQILDPETYDDMEAMVQLMYELRKGKMTEEKVRASLKQANYFGTMLVKMGKADCLLGGATYSTADTVRPALQLIKTKPGSKIVSSCFVLIRGDEKIVFGDCAINIEPNEEELADIAMESARTAEIFGLDPKVAMLCYSTFGSGKGADVDKMRRATEIAKEKYPDLVVDGEIQFDAAVSPEVASLKCPTSPIAGCANVFIVPNISAGNITYKVASRLGGYEAIGPVMQGLNAPINDLSRGCNADEVYKMSLVTAALS